MLHLSSEDTASITAVAGVLEAQAKATAGRPIALLWSDLLGEVRALTVSDADGPSASLALIS